MRISKLYIVIFISLLVLVGCGSETDNENNNSQNDSTEGKKEITVGVSPVYLDIANVIKETFDSEEYSLDVQLFDDNILPNTALEEGSVDINFFQHEVYLDQYNESNGTDIKAYDDGFLKFFMGIYPKEIEDLDSLKDGASVSIPNDNANRSRALKTLEHNKLITLKDDVEFPTTLDIVENPKNLDFIEMDVLNQASSIEDTDISVINSITVTQAGLDASDAIARESKEESDRYAIVVALMEDTDSEEYAEQFIEAAFEGDLDDYLKENFGEALYLNE